MLTTYNLLSLKNVESGLKYFIYGIISSIFLLISLYCIYFLYGTFNFYKIIILMELFSFERFEFLNQFILKNLNFFFKINFLNFNLLLYYICFLLMLSSILFKIGSAPFHIWVVEIYSNITLFSFFFLFLLSNLFFV